MRKLSTALTSGLLLAELFAFPNLIRAQSYWDPVALNASPGSGGTGTWSTAANWWVSGTGDTTWTTGNIAYFEGTAGTVTLGAAETADGLTFTTPNYTLSGSSTLTLAGSPPTITIPTGSTIISAKLAGTSGMGISGAGPLYLEGANTITNTVTIPAGCTVWVTAGGYTTGGAGTGPVAISGNGAFNLTNIPALANTSVTGGSSSTMTIYLVSGNCYLTNSLASFTGTYNVDYANFSVNGGQLVVGSGASISPNINSAATWNIYAGSVIDFNGGQTDPATVNLYGMPYATATDGALRLDNSIQSGNVVLYGNTAIGNGTATTTSVISGAISDTGSGYGFTFRSGAASTGLELQGVNTYRGATVVSNGTLLLNGVGSIANSSNILLADGTTFDVTGVTGGAYFGSLGYQIPSSQALGNYWGSAGINGNIDATAGGPLSFVYSSANIPLSMNGTLTVNNNPVTVTIVPGNGFSGGGGNQVILATGVNGTVASSPLTVIQPNASYTAGNAPTVTLNGNALSLTINNPVVTTYSPFTYSNLFIYSNGIPPAFTLSANGASAFQWYSNGVAISGANNNTYSYAQGTLPIGKLTNYCVASSSAGVATNFWVLNVISTNSYVSNSEVYSYPPYPLAVLQSTNASGVIVPPVSYWRLDEADNGQGNGNANAPVNDWLGGNIGTYTGVNLGSAGYSPTLDPTETAADFGVFTTTAGGSLATMPTNGNLNFVASGQSVNFSVECWVNAAKANVKAYDALVSEGTYASDDSFVLAINAGGSTTDRYYRFYVGGTGHSVSTTTSSTTASGSWQHLVGVCNESAGFVYLYINGVQVGTPAAISPTAGLDYNGAPILFGYETGTPSGDGQWDGLIDDVAIYNYALPASTILAHYNAKGTPPSVTMITSTNVDYGAPLTIAPTLESGTAPLTNSWLDSNANTVVSTSPTLTIPAATTDKYILTVENAFSPPGSTNTVAVNAIQGAPSFASPGFNITPTAQTVYVGTPVTFSVLAYGTYPLSYLWYNQNGSIPGATNTSYTVDAQEGTNTYYCEVNNGISPAATSSTATLVGTLVPIDHYAKTILSNSPVAYWRLNEAPDNGSGNYGTIAYDYVSGHNLTYNGVELDQPGVSLTDSNSGGLFGTYTTPNSYAGEINQSSSGIAPIDLVANSPEFTVEAWVKSSISQTSGAGILAKGYGTDVQFALTSTNDYFCFYFYESTSTTLVSAQSTDALDNDGLWHHIVGVADTIGEVSGTGAHLYVDGVDDADGYGQAGKGLEDPGSSSVQDLVSIGARASGNSANLPNQFVGNIAEVAIYNYAMGSNQVAVDYAAGVLSPQFAQIPQVSITNVTQVRGTSLTLTWTSMPGYTYQVQVSSSLSPPAWTNLGGPVSATGTSTSYTDTSTYVTSGAGAYYRVLGYGYYPGY